MRALCGRRIRNSRQGLNGQTASLHFGTGWCTGNAVSMDDRKINGLNDRKDCCVNAVGAWSPANLRAWTIGSVAVVDARSSLDASLSVNFFAGDTATACAGSGVRLCPPGLKGSLVFLLPIRYRTALAKEIRGASSFRENHSLMGIAPVSSICRQYSCSSSGRTSQGRFHPVSQRRSVSSTGYSVKKCPASITGMRDSSSA